MTVVNIHEAKTHLSRLIERAEAGEDIVIGRAGKPVAKLVAFKEARPARVAGAWRGRVTIADDFDQVDAEADWYGNA